MIAGRVTDSMPNDQPNQAPVRQNKLKELLEVAANDLEDAEFPSLIRVFLEPVNDIVLAPLATEMSKALPPKPIPVVDEIGSGVVSFLSFVAKTAYGVVGSHEDLGKDVENKMQKKRSIVSPVATKGMVMSTLSSGVGFAWHSLLDVLTTFWNFKWLKWAFESSDLISFLYNSGTLQLLTDGAFSDKHIPEDVAVIQKVQMRTFIPSRIDVSRDIFDGTLPSESHHYMKYATAAYGDAMMKSVDFVFAGAAQTTEIASDCAISECSAIQLDRARNEDEKDAPIALKLVLLPVDVGAALLKGSMSIIKSTARTMFSPISNASCAMTDSYNKVIKKAIARYIGVPVSDIVYMSKYYWGGSPDILRHFVAIDREHEAIVLSLRGTYSVSGLLTDLNFDAISYCDGFAHNGFAKMANAIWHDDTTINAINDAFKATGFTKFIITGHSLGAGTAVLLNILFHYENFSKFNTKPTTVRCYAYACPPAFSLLHEGMSSSVKLAVARTEAYIHEVDCVPFLSGNEVLELTKMVGDIDTLMGGMGLDERKKIVSGEVPVPTDVQDRITSVQEPTKFVAIGMDKLFIPARSVWWLYRPTKDKNEKPSSEMTITYKVEKCDPLKVSGLSIQLNERMISDHFPSGYESALASIQKHTGA